MLFISKNSVVKAQFRFVHIIFYRNYRRKDFFLKFRNSYVIRRSSLNFKKSVVKLWIYFAEFDFSSALFIRMSLNLRYLKYNLWPEWNNMSCKKKKKNISRKAKCILFVVDLTNLILILLPGCTCTYNFNS